jgi:hypothetical protein
VHLFCLLGQWTRRISSPVVICIGYVIFFEYVFHVCILIYFNVPLLGLQALLDLIDAEDSMENRRFMLHCAVLQANSVVVPGQSLSGAQDSLAPSPQTPSTSGSSEAMKTQQAKGVKRVRMYFCLDSIVIDTSMVDVMCFI